MRFVLSALALSLALRALPAAAACAPVSSASGLCTSINGNTCTISDKQCPVVADSTLDFGTQDVVFSHGSTLDVSTGTMTVKAKSLTLQPGTALLGHGGSIVVQTTGDIVVLRPSQGSPARIDVSDPALADQIELVSSGGAIQIDGVLDARGTNTDGTGGSIDVTGANVLVSGDVRADGGNLGFGGAVSLEASTGGVNVSGTIEVFGGSGGPLDLRAEGTLTATGTIDIRALAAGGDGGLLTVDTSKGSVTLGGKIFLQGDAGTDTDGGANGGDLDVFSAGALTLSAAFEISGAPPDGQGGDVFLMSAQDTILTGSMLVQGRGAESDGGTVEFDSQGAITLGVIDVHGGENLPDSGGSLQATAWCDLTVPGGVTISVEGENGDIHLLSGGQIFAAGNLRAGAPIRLEYRTLLPNTAGGTFLPELDPFVQNLTLTPCGGFPPESCGDHHLDLGEECDDGNSASCDKCSSTCKIEMCGNGRIDCGEACDDGNRVDGDGCHGDCTRVEHCGDAYVDGLETCDDGNQDACDGCSATCQTESCGNGVVECGEECEPPGVGGCSADCSTFIPPGCGDGVKAGQEECDDHNVIDGDGCSHQCREERCGNGTLDPHEECDDFNTSGCDGCAPDCKLETCGNGVVDCGEECDDGDGNGAPGGSCLPSCTFGPICSQNGPQPCIPCATAFDCDPRGKCVASCDSGECVPVVPCDDQNACNGVETCEPTTGKCTAGTPVVCDNSNLCNGQMTCEPTTGKCKGTPVVCHDTDVCDGLMTCDPTSGTCKNGPPLKCDDNDACTFEHCDAVGGCVVDPGPSGLPLAQCRVQSVRDLVAKATGTDINVSIRTKLLKKLDGVDGRIATANQAGGNTKKVRKSLKAAGRQLQAAIRFVTKQRGKKITAGTADALVGALTPLPPLVAGLTP